MNRTVALLLIPIAAVIVAVPRWANAISNDDDIVENVTSAFARSQARNASRPHTGNEGVSSRRLDAGPGMNESPERAPIGAFPWIVALAEKGLPAQEGYICAGVLVAQNWVLTAAHCTSGNTQRWPVDAEFHVLTGTSALAAPGPAAAITKIMLHPDYNPQTQANDLALLKIEGANEGIPIRLEGPPVKGMEGAIAQILGWGVTNQTLLQKAAGEHLQVLQAAVVGERCFSAANYRSLRGTGVFCAESILKFHDTCYRFGGGPVLLHDAAGERYLGGLVSWSAACRSDTRKPNIYLDVQAHLPWIKGVIGGHAGKSP